MSGYKWRLLLLLLFSGTQRLQAQNILLSGKVVDEKSREALPGANIYLKSDWQTGTASSASGEFSLEIPAGNTKDTLLISFIGYKEKLVPLSRERQQVLYIALTAREGGMQEVVVEKTPFIAEEFSYQKIERLDIYKNPAAKADPLLAVNSLPAATTLDESASISLRGASPVQTGIFLNEVPIYDAVRFSQLNGIGTFSIFNTAIIDRLLVFGGNPPLTYGNTSSGLISLHTTATLGSKSSYSLNLSAASFGVLSSQPLSQKSSITVFANYQPALLIKALNKKALEKIKGFEMADAGIHLLYRPSASSHLKVFSYATKEAYDYSFEHPSWQGIFKQQKTRSISVANYQKRLGLSLLSLNGGLSFAKTEYRYSAAHIKLQNHDYYLSASHQYAGKKLDIKTGINLDSRQQYFKGSTYLYSYALGEAHPRLEGQNQSAAVLAEAYTYLKYYLSSNWMIGGGARKNLPLNQQPSFMSKQLNLRHNFSKQLSAILALGVYHQQLLEQREQQTSTFLKSRQLSADLQYTRKKLAGSLSLFIKKDFLGSSQQQVAGLEAFVEAKPLSSLSARLSYTYLSSEAAEKNSHHPAPYDLNWIIKGSLQWQFHPLWSCGIHYLFRQGSLYVPVVAAEYLPELGAYKPLYAAKNEQVRYPAYRLADLSLSRFFTFRDKFSLIAFGSVNNLFNFKNIRAYRYDASYSHRQDALFAQRSWYMGLSINF